MNFRFFNQKQKKEIGGPSVAALRYDPNSDAPVVIAQGKGHLARKIIEMAKEKNIPIQEDPLLVENLIDMDLGDTIPPQLYLVVAEILLMIEEMEGTQNKS
ncbi:flagellar biosynthesis protein, putative [Heliomicrobium modesticaldum Ice1]|uniref:Flagellar biosynthesis protein, putative n=1 Tax=Heliobacterium modesticaldum (strain ATCC 51547 / Ice1) TaxID=498761 RepID=B0TGZ7_HELMI|nr:EscU/YscU/HrcU family type III secretion system export apparatus switch protein [Heliomicrobium modesticaldum]ABZ83322.1 flagellar biosynthesis protein, putative [Heliomicrobium modesticaldum Ice1]